MTSFSEMPTSDQVELLCIRCGQVVRPIIHGAPSNSDSEMYDDGIADSIVAGYGSKHDTEKFVLAICDDCIDALLDEGKLIHVNAEVE